MIVVGGTFTQVRRPPQHHRHPAPQPSSPSTRRPARSALRSIPTPTAPSTRCCRPPTARRSTSVACSPAHRTAVVDCRSRLFKVYVAYRCARHATFPPGSDQRATSATSSSPATGSGWPASSPTSRQWPSGARHSQRHHRRLATRFFTGVFTGHAPRPTLTPRTTNVLRSPPTRSNTQLTAVGNFTSAQRTATARRSLSLDITGPKYDVVASWYTNALHSRPARRSFETYMTDVEYSPERLVLRGLHHRRLRWR